jgi:hypothetical protein
MSFAAKLAAPVEVRVTRGLRYQIQRVDTLDLLRTGKGGILRAAIEEVKRAGGKVAESDDEIAKLGARVAQVGLDQIGDMNEHTKAVVCAGVVGGFDEDAGAFEAVRLVLTQAEQDLSAPVPRVWVTHVQPDLKDLFMAIMSLSTGHEGAPEVSALFRHPLGGSEAAHVGDGVPHDAVDGGAVVAAGDGV